VTGQLTDEDRFPQSSARLQANVSTIVSFCIPIDPTISLTKGNHDVDGLDVDTTGKQV
jgi:hypothetical protein